MPLKIKIFFSVERENECREERKNMQSQEWSERKQKEKLSLDVVEMHGSAEDEHIWSTINYGR